jgi:hypothetical protein
MSFPKKYPRTFHLTFSAGRGSDDKVLDGNDHFLGKPIVITSKLDGSNFCITNEECFARTHSGPPTHKSFDLAKALHNEIKYSIPEHFAVYAEYCFAEHAINYTSLPHYINIFNVLDLKRNVWLSWDDVGGVADSLNIPTVPLLFQGVITTNKDLTNICSSLMSEKEFGVDSREGVVVRLANEFDDKDFSTSIAKSVRKGHVEAGDEHWAHKEIIKNGLKK